MTSEKEGVCGWALKDKQGLTSQAERKEKHPGAEQKVGAKWRQKVSKHHRGWGTRGHSAIERHLLGPGVIVSGMLLTNVTLFGEQ